MLRFLSQWLTFEAQGSDCCPFARIHEEQPSPGYSLFVTPICFVLKSGYSWRLQLHTSERYCSVTQLKSSLIINSTQYFFSVHFKAGSPFRLDFSNFDSLFPVTGSEWQSCSRTRLFSCSYRPKYEVFSLVSRFIVLELWYFVRIV